jgi:hypothetical protein
MADYDFFVTIVAGDNPEELMKSYDKNITVEPYIVYKYEDAGMIKQRYLDVCKSLVSNGNLDDDELKDMLITINEVEEMDDDDFYFDYTQDYILDPKTGNAMSDKNKNGKWSSYRMGDLFSVPFKTLDGNETNQARKKDIDWSKMHLSGQEVYIRAWELVMEKREPINDDEKTIYENMKNRTGYFEKFGTKENYVANSTAFWGYAFLSKETGWVQLEDNMNQFDWVTQFYDKFIKPLDENTLLTSYETRQ